MRALSDLQARILKEEFPHLHLDSDSDIERYFELRSLGRQGEALGIYNARLRKKYPDDAKRAILLGYYRSRDPRFSSMLRESHIALADRLIRRTVTIIDTLTRDIETVDMTDAYPVIKLAEGLLSIISPDRFQAVAFCEKYCRLARLVNHKPAQMDATAELLRLYVNDTIESVQELKKAHEEKKRTRIAAERAGKERKKNQFDLSRIVFSPADVQKILIPEGITRTEDKVIAYCLRYWNRVSDPAFEKTIFLYSRKYRTKHSDIYLAVKNGRDHLWKDEEILNAVLANVVTGYYYSITGDVYLQRTWARYKAMVELPPAGGVQQELALPAAIVPPAPVKKPKRAATKARSPSGKPKKVIRAAKKVVPLKIERKPATERSPFANSIADIIKKKTGKTYTVYKELFFQKIRPAIRTTLSLSADKKGGLFTSRQNDAEELVYAFLYDNYNNPYQNWVESDSRKKCENLGYPIKDIEPIITRWIEDNR